VIPSRWTSVSPLSRMLLAMHVKSPFSHNALFGFMSIPLYFGKIVKNAYETRAQRGFGQALVAVGNTIVTLRTVLARGHFKFKKHCQLFVAASDKLLPLSPCASAIQIVRPLESIAETQLQLQLEALRLSAMISQ
jgi:hypothetical protein